MDKNQAQLPYFWSVGIVTWGGSHLEARRELTGLVPVALQGVRILLERHALPPLLVAPRAQLCHARAEGGALLRDPPTSLGLKL